MVTMKQMPFEQPLASDTPQIHNLVKQMQNDWNDRAREDAKFYIACGRRNEDEATFSDHATEVVDLIRRAMIWLPPGQPDSRLRLLEIGCGIGRLMGHLIDDCGEIHGVDISDEMVALGRQRLAHHSGVHLHHAAHSDLRDFADGSFDLVYSFAVLQHLPHGDLVWRYLDDAARVLRLGGILAFQVNTLPIVREHQDTWSGVVLTADEVVSRCHANGLRLRAVEGEGTQYTWITAQKSPAAVPRMSRPARIVAVEDSDGVADRVPARDTLTLTVEFLPTEACDVSELDLSLADQSLPIIWIGPAGAKRERKVIALGPTQTSESPADLVLRWRGEAISPARLVERVAALGLGARVERMTDGVELSNFNVSSSGWVKLWLMDWFGDPVDFRVSHRGAALYCHFHCDDIRRGAWQINVRLPDGIAPGPTELHVVLAAPPTPPVILPLTVEAAH